MKINREGLLREARAHLLGLTPDEIEQLCQSVLNEISPEIDPWADFLPPLDDEN